MQPIQIISQDVFDKVRSRFSNLEMGDQTGAVTINPTEARFFDFDFVVEGNNLGRVSISLNDLGSLKVYYSQGITENYDDPVKKEWFNFLREMRYFSMRRLLRFDTRDIAKTNLDKNDFKHLAVTQGPEEPDMKNMNESRWDGKNSRKTSRAVAGRTEVIVRHAKPVEETYPGARSQKNNIKAIFIQNSDGERYKYPFIHPAGAFALAQHVDHGGIPHDPAGKAIIQMSEQIAQLQEFQRKIQRTSLHDDAHGIAERAVGRLNELKAKINAIGKRHHYENWMMELASQPTLDDDTMELDAVTMEEYKSKFTQSTFQEELAGYFPLLHKIMRETNRIELEDYVAEVWDDEVGYDTDDPKHPEYAERTADHADQERKRRREEPNESFEIWAEAMEQGKLTDDQIAALKQAIDQLPQGPEGPALQLGPNGQTAIQFFSELGLDDKELEEKLEAAAKLDATSNGLDAFALWVEQDYPELGVVLGISGTGEQQAAAESVSAPGDGTDSELEQYVIQLWRNGKDVKDIAHEVAGNSPETSPSIEQIEQIIQNYEAGGDWDDYNNDTSDYAKDGPDWTDEATHPGSGGPGLSTVHGMMPSEGAASSPISINGKEVDVDSLDVDGIDTRDYPDFSDAFFSTGYFIDGTEMSGDELDQLTNTASELLYQKIESSLYENDEGTMGKGMMPAEGHDPQDMIKEVAKIVKSFYNRDNPEVGPFRGHEGIAIDVKKSISEKFGEEAGEQAREIAEKFMEKLAQEWHQKHGKVEHDGLARLKELVGNVKHKVESMENAKESKVNVPEMADILKLAGIKKI